MSDSESGNRDWRLYVTDMIKFCERVLSYTAGMERDTFIGDSRTYDATIRNLQLIGQAASRIPTSVREAHREIPWRSIIGTRNRVVHAYLGIDDNVVWDIIQTDIPDLLPKLRQLLDSAETDRNNDPPS